MKPKLSLRWRLTIWYSTIVLVSLIAFAFYAYYWVFNELYSNLDESLMKISNTLSFIIEEEASNIENYGEKGNLSYVFSGNLDKFTLFKKEEKSRFIGPLRPNKNGVKNKRSDVVWSAIFTHLLLNPDNYYIQIADTNQQIVWKSRNLEAYEMPVDRTYQSGKVKNSPYNQFTFYDNVIIGKEKLRLFVNRNEYSIITIAYTVRDVQNTLQSLFSAILLAVPIIFFVSIMGGIALAKMSLKPVDKMTKTANDITARNLTLRIEEPDTDDEISRLAKTLNDMIRRLQQSFIKIQQFTSDASHELRTPLTILRGELEVALTKERTEDDYIEVLGSALEEVIRLSNVVESLLQLSRADGGHSRLSFERRNLSVLIEDIIEDMSIIAEQKEIELISDVQKGVISQFDEGKIHQAVLNIIDNAVKYTPENGKVKVSLKDREHYVEIKVSDNGVGMSQEELTHIFDRFYRVDKARSSENIKGSGLGLSIVKWIVEAHNGKIFVESQPKKGTNFIMMLPKSQNL
ncbi:MAG: carbapenam-3-carboxylate synthase domain-containing protein [bacterium]